MAEDLYDVVIVGAGAGGGACAWALCNAGVNVLVLEAGPAYNPKEDYLLHKTNWEQQDFPTKTPHGPSYSFGKMQRLEKRWEKLRSWNHITGKMNKSEHRRGWRYHHVKGVGGSTLHFTGEAHRMHPEAMNMRTRFGVGADWPINYDELEAFYTEAEKIVGVAGGQNTNARHRSEPYPLPAHPFSYASQQLAKGCQRLGLQWEPNPVAVLSEPYDGRPECNYCGNCPRGCPRSDKGSVDVTFIRQAVNTGNCSIRTGVSVTAISAGKNDKVKGVNYLDSNGNNHSVEAKVIVVACGAIATPQLLLVSGVNGASEGLANESGQVGKNFMESVAWTSSGLANQPIDSYRGLPSDGICWNYNAPDAIPNVVGGCRFTLATSEADLVGPINYAQRVVKGWGRAHKQTMRETFGRVISIGAMGESLPNPKSFVDLDPRVKNKVGLPVPRINSYLDDTELRRLSFMADKCREMLSASGIENIFEEYGTYDVFSSSHVFGTCRMGNDPAKTVVNKDCRSHRWNNLFIIDASVFPSSGGGEAPSLTIEALAIRAGRKINKLLTEKTL